MKIDRPTISDFSESVHDHSTVDNGGRIPVSSIDGFSYSGPLSEDQILVYGYGYGYDGWTNINALDYFSAIGFPDFSQINQISTTGNVTIGGTGLFSNGTELLPSISFSSDQNTGIYRLNTDNIGISTAGVLRFDIATTIITATLPIVIPIGSVSEPSIRFATELGTGIHSPAGGYLNIGCSSLDVVSFSQNTIEFFVGSNNSFNIYYSSNFEQQTSNFVRSRTGLYVINDQISYLGYGFEDILIQGGAGADASPDTNGDRGQDIRFIAGTGGDSPDQNFPAGAGGNIYVTAGNGGDFESQGGGVYITSGIGSDADGNITLSSNSASIIMSAIGGTFFTGRIFADQGTSSLPSISFNVDPNTGIFSGGEDVLSMVAGGAARMTVSTVQIASTLPWRGPAGSVSFPALSFDADVNTGIYNSSADNIGIANGGVITATFKSDNTVDFAKAIYYTMTLEQINSGPHSLDTSLDRGRFFNNTGASALTQHNLPASGIGVVYEFIVTDADGIRINANTGQTIRFSTNVSASAGYIQSTDLGATVRIIGITASSWAVVSALGIWTVA